MKFRKLSFPGKKFAAPALLGARGRSQQRGFLSMELTVVLILVGVAAAGIAYSMNENSKRQKVEASQQLLQNVAFELKKQYGMRYATVTTERAVRSNVVPDQFKLSPSTAQNPYDGLLAFTPATLTTANDAVDITWPNQPSNRCSDLVTATENLFRRVSVAGTVVKPIDGDLNVATLSDQCVSAGTVAITFSVGRS